MENKQEISYENLKYTAPLGMEPVPEKKRKPAGMGSVLLFFLIVMAVFLVLGSAAQYFLGMAGLVITELLFLAASVLFVALRRLDPRQVFPLGKPRLWALGGTAVLWLAGYLSMMVVTLILAYFFPAGVYGESGATNTVIQSIPWGLSFLVVAVLPAICEEALHRGVIQYGVRNSLTKTWQIVLLMGALFGVFHVSLWKFLPTAMLGALMSYILLKTGNMFYSSFFHFFHNGIQMLLMLALPAAALLPGIPLAAPAEEMYAYIKEVLPLSIGIYLCISALAPYLFYLGNWMLNRACAWGKQAFFPRGKERTCFLGILLPTIGLLLAGSLVLVTGALDLMRAY